MQLFFLDPFWYMTWFLWPYRGDTDGILLYSLQLWYDYIILLQNVEWVLGNLRKKSDEINALFAGKTIDRLGV